MNLDEGFMYGLGAFETIAIENRNPILLEKHLERLNKTLKFLNIEKKIETKDIEKVLVNRVLNREVIKVMVSQNNMIVDFRENPYSENNYETGFQLRYSTVLRNDTSPFTYHKTLNYGDCIFERRKHSEYNESIFLNRKNEICEGTFTNIFVVKNGKMKTPKLLCGLLPGIVRNFLLEHYEIEESIILYEEMEEYEECFVTNSLLGIMPVRSIDKIQFMERSLAVRLRKEYMQYFHIS